MMLFDNHYRLVYDIQQTRFQAWGIMAVGLVPLAIGISIAFLRKKGFAISITPVGFLNLGIFWIGFVGYDYLSYAALARSARQGKFEMIEGRITNFAPWFEGGHGNESFVLNGHKFSYSDYDLSKGFNQTRSYDGPIREGLQVRIAAVGDNIVRLEIAE